jgi:phospholipid-binding lipoprotein MlaA
MPDAARFAVLNPKLNEGIHMIFASDRQRLTAIIAVLAVSGGGCAHSPAEDPQDPLEPVNRVVFKFDQKADHYVLKPVAQAYDYVTPSIAQHGISNFFDNLAYPKTIVNDLLQGKLTQTASDTGRLVVNTTLGIGGIFDVATGVGMTKHDADFGQTLGLWGIGPGWYIVLPLFGPSDNRDLVGLAADHQTDFQTYLPGRYDVYKYSAAGVNLINARAEALPADRLMTAQIDPYIFVRTAYLQKRSSLIEGASPAPVKPPSPSDPLPTDEGGALP